MAVFKNSVALDSDRCMGCINCIKRCPTQAIRVRNGKAHIIQPFCIDCGECIRVCPHHAKLATYDPLEVMEQFKYKIALPAPSFYGQFNHLDDTNIVLSALLKMGFDDVYEVSAAAELVSELSRKYIEAHKDQCPFISTACPSVMKLIRVRFPNLIEHMLPMKAPIEIAAAKAREKAVKETGLKPEEIGVIFLTPCPAKVTAIHYPLTSEFTNIDAAVAIREVYTRILPFMKEVQDSPEELSHSGKIGISWGASGGEATGLLTDSYLAADGIENVIKVLEDLEDQKFADLDFIELNACSGGCVGGVLQVENPYVAKAKLKRLRRYMPVAKSRLENEPVADAMWENEIEYQPVFDLGSDFMDSFEKMEKVEQILKKLPSLDCGSCGAPTCRALAEDVVRGVASEKDCIHLLREYIHKISTDLQGI